MKGLLMIGLLMGSASAFACKDGAKASFFEYKNGKQVQVVKTCANGTYMTAAEQAAYVYNPSNKCKEGNVIADVIADKSGGNIGLVRVCKNGSYMTDAERAAYVRNPSSGCKKVGSFSTREVFEGGHDYLLTLQCQANGKYKVISKRRVYGKQ